MEFKPYEAKLITRTAFQITPNHVILRPKNVDDCEYTIGHIEQNIVTSPLKFKAYQVPVVGDWIVRLTDEDTYHCTDAVFRERNIVS